MFPVFPQGSGLHRSVLLPVTHSLRLSLTDAFKNGDWTPTMCQAPSSLWDVQRREGPSPPLMPSNLGSCPSSHPMRC